MPKNFRECGWLLAIAFVAYLMISQLVFAFRHPWATDTERLLYIGDAFLFRAVPYDEMRPR